MTEPSAKAQARKIMQEYAHEANRLELLAEWTRITHGLQEQIEVVLASKDAELAEAHEEIEALTEAILDNDRPYPEIRAERLRQELLRSAGKFTHTCASVDFTAFSHFARTAVLGEEYGEVCRAALDVQGIAEGRTNPGLTLRKLRTELVQVAAVAVAYLEAIDKTAVTANESDAR